MQKHWNYKNIYRGDRQMKKNRIKFLMIEFLLLMLAVFFVWKIFDQNVAETRIAVILPEDPVTNAGMP